MKMKRIPVKEPRNALASAFTQYHQLPKMMLLSKRVVDTAIYFLKRNTTGSTRYIQLRDFQQLSARRQRIFNQRSYYFEPFPKRKEVEAIAFLPAHLHFDITFVHSGNRVSIPAFDSVSPVINLGLTELSHWCLVPTARHKTWKYESMDVKIDMLQLKILVLINLPQSDDQTRCST
jgi:hypothetical protein